MGQNGRRGAVGLGSSVPYPKSFFLKTLEISEEKPRSEPRTSHRNKMPTNITKIVPTWIFLSSRAGTTAAVPSQT